MRSSSEARDIVPNEEGKEAGSPQTRRNAVDNCSVAGTKLMSAAASPGRTWSIIVSAGCQLWLQRLQPLFFTVAILSLVYQIWLIRTRPPKRRKLTVKAVLAGSLLLNFVVIGGWVVLLIRYQ